MSDRTFTLQRAQINARSWVLVASGAAARPQARPGGPVASKTAPSRADAYVKDLQVRWDLRVTDLSVLGPQLGGTLQASGALKGAPSSFGVDLDAKSSLSLRGSPPGAVAVRVHAQGLPFTPTADVDVRGIVDSSPLTLSASLRRDGRKGFEASIRRGEWKSARAEGDMTFSSSIDDARGHLRLAVGQLADLDRLLGDEPQGQRERHGRFHAAGRTHPHANFQLDAQGSDARALLRARCTLAGEGRYRAGRGTARRSSRQISAAYPASWRPKRLSTWMPAGCASIRAALNYRGAVAHLLSPGAMSPMRRVSTIEALSWVRRMRPCASRAGSCPRSMRAPRCSTSIRSSSACFSRM